jgi:hypothetical protein
MPAFGQTMTGTPPQTLMSDKRTGYEQAREIQNMQQHQNVAAEYQRALRDPNYALGDPAQQDIQKNQLLDETAAGLGERGITGGAAKAQLSKTVADFKIGQLKERQRALEELRQRALTGPVTGTDMAAQPTSGSPGLIQQTAGAMMPTMMEQWMKKIFAPAATPEQPSAGIGTSDITRPTNPQPTGGMDIGV